MARTPSPEMRERAATTTIGVLACTTIISMVVFVLQLIAVRRWMYGYSHVNYVYV